MRKTRRLFIKTHRVLDERYRLLKIPDLGMSHFRFCLMTTVFPYIVNSTF